MIHQLILDELRKANFRLDVVESQVAEGKSKTESKKTKGQKLSSSACKQYKQKKRHKK